jgi:hypothetical protein
MEEFRRFTCWDRQRVAGTMHTEADAPPIAVFLATHVGVPIFRNVVGLRGQRTQVTEADVLNDLLALPVDMPILPILGGAGTGKSHLVRWLFAQLRPSESRQVVWIPKYRTSLRGVIERILAQAEGAEFDELRESVMSAAEGLTPWEARVKLLAMLATRVELYGAGSPDAEDYEHRELLAQRLPALLHDPVFREQLLASEATIDRIVREKLEGRSAEDKDEPFTFNVEDLPLRPTDLTKAGRVAQDLMGLLLGHPALQLTAVAMMNEQLDTSVSEVFGIGGGQLRDLMLRLRRLLQAQHVELVLLVEDFMMLQGIQSELLEAIIAAPIREGPQDLCTMRVALAVTSGYFEQMRETVRSRTLNEYRLDVPLAELPVDGVLGFVSAYLNAARVGVDDLKQAYEASRGETAWIPNACAECKVREPCHKGFGHHDGWGLYPFNPAVLTRIVRGGRSDDSGSFVPRDVLTTALRPILDQQLEPIREGSFPGEEFAREFYGPEGQQLSADVRYEIRKRDPRYAARREALLEYWGGAPEHLVNLASEVHLAFDIPRIDEVPTLTSPTAGPPKKRITTVVVETPTTPPSTLPSLVAAVDEWGRNGTLSQGDKNALRHLVHRTVVANLGLEDGYWRSGVWIGREVGDPGHSRPRIFRFERVLLGEQDREPDEPGLLLGWRTLDDVMALRSLAWFDAVGHWRFPNGVELQRLVHRRVDLWTETVRRRLLPTGLGGEAPNDLAVLVRTLLLGAQILGLPGSVSGDPEGLLRAVFDLGSGGRGSQDGSKWGVLCHHVVSGTRQSGASRQDLRDQLLRLSSFSQGGSPQAVHVGRLIPIVTAAAAESDLPEPQKSLPSPLRTHIQVLKSALPDAVEEQVGRLRSWLSTVAPLIPEADEGLAGVVKSIDATLAAAGRFALLPSNTRTERLALDGQRVAEGPGRSLVEEVASVLGRWDAMDLGERLGSLANEREPGLTEMETYLQTVARTLVHVNGEVHAMLGEGRGSVGIEIKVMTDAFVALERGLAILAGAGGEGQA